MSEKEIFAILDGNKKVTEADKKFVRAHILPKIAQTPEQPEVTVANPFTQQVLPTNPLIAELVNFTQRMAYADFSAAVLRAYNVSAGKAIQVYDRARMLILKLDKEIYAAVID